MVLEMNTTEATSYGGNIKAHSEDVKELHAWLENVVKEQLPTIWKGSGYEGFAERVEELAPSFKAMEQLILDIGDGVIKNAQEYENFDMAAAAANRRC